MKKVTYEPAPTLLPGKTIDEVLEELDMTPLELASRMGLPTAEVNGVIDGTHPISADFTTRLEKLLQVRQGFRQSRDEPSWVVGAEIPAIDPL